MSRDLQGDYSKAVERRRTEQLAFALAIQSGEQPMDGRLARRARLYILAARGTYHEVERLVMKTKGYAEEQRGRHAKESCFNCIEYEGRGWQPLGTLPPIGDSECLTDSKCSFEYRKIGSGSPV